MISKTKQDTGVSPVVGVILMVAITVILAAVIAGFVLDLGSSISEDADAAVSFDQSYNFADESYTMDINTVEMTNADFLYVESPVNDSSEGDDDENVEISGDIEASDNVDGDVALATDAGHSIEISDLEAGDEVQVIGVLSGDETVIATQTIQDTQG